MKYFYVVMIASILGASCKKQKQEDVRITAQANTYRLKLNRFIAITQSIAEDDIGFDTNSKMFYSKKSSFEIDSATIAKLYNIANEYKATYER